MRGLDLMLERPWWLLALIPAVLALALSQGRGGGLAAWRRAVDAPILAAMEALGRVVPGQAARAWAPAALAAVLAVALAGPATKGDGAPAFHNLDGLVVLMDLSPSVAESGALDRARTSVRRIVAARGTRPVSVIAFAGDAYLVVPFTADERLVSQAVAVLGPGVVPDPGTRPERAIALASGTIAEAGLIAADVVLVSDGGGVNDAALDRAAMLATEGRALSTVRVPPDPDERFDLNAARQGMEHLAAAGNGLPVEAGGIEPLLSRLDAGAAVSEDRLSALGRRDLGPWLLGLALVPAIFLFRRRP